jgi:surfeit locus 1 family protein
MANSDKGAAALDYAAPAGAAPARRRGFHYSFRPRLWPTLALLVLVPTFISLGQWQWRKAEAKSELQSLLDARSHEPAVQLAGAPVDAASLRYRRVVVRGEYEPAYQILIDNRVYGEQAGYHLLTPLRIAGSDLRVLVNRGWLPAGADHQQLPALATPAGPLEVRGLAQLPTQKFFTLGDSAAGLNPAATGWQPLWQNLDLAAYRKAVPFAVQPVVILLDPDSPAGGFVRDWPRPDERIERHIGYAWQWFGFAAASVGIWLFVNFRRCA